MEWIKKDREWSEYPKGTLARGKHGGQWEKRDDGWVWWGESKFPEPGNEFDGFVQLPEDPEPIKTVILDHIADLVTDFCYYDRKNSESLTMEDLNKAVTDGTITIDEMVEEFRTHLVNAFE